MLRNVDFELFVEMYSSNIYYDVRLFSQILNISTLLIFA